MRKMMMIKERDDNDALIYSGWKKMMIKEY